MIHSNLKKLNICYGLLISDFSFAISVLYYLSFGLNLSDVFYLKSVYALFSLIFEIPSGFWADRYGKRKVALFGIFFQSSAQFILAFGGSFFYFLVFEIVMSIGVSLVSGTFESLIHDKLEDNNLAEKSISQIGKLDFSGLISLALSSFIGGFLFKYSHNIPFIINGILYLISAAILIQLKYFDDGLQTSTDSKLTKTISIVFENYKQTLLNKNTIGIFLFGAMLFFMINCIVWLMQPHLKEVQISEGLIGIVFTSIILITAIGSLFANKLNKKYGETKIYILVSFLLLISTLLLSMQVSLLIILPYALIGLIRGVYRTTIVSSILSRASSFSKASVLSSLYFLGNLLFIIFSPLIGRISSTTNIGSAYLSLFILFTGCIGIFFSWLIYRSKNSGIDK